MGPDVDLADQDFKATIINIFTELNENMSSELKKKHSWSSADEHNKILSHSILLYRLHRV